MGLISRINYRTTYLDVNIIIYAIEAYNRYLAVVRELFGAIDAGKIPTVTSELTLAEALVGPFSQNDPTLERAYETAIVTRPHFEVVPVSRQVLVHAARIRSGHKSIRLADAIHVATALEHNCEVFLTNDTRLNAIGSIEVLLLNDFLGME